MRIAQNASADHSRQLAWRCSLDSAHAYPEAATYRKEQGVRHPAVKAQLVGPRQKGRAQHVEVWEDAQGRAPQGGLVANLVA